jgi:hypothetical protein
MIRRQPRKFDLSADEAAARVAPFLKPVGEDEPTRIVVGLSGDGLKKGWIFALHSHNSCWPNDTAQQQGGRGRR